MWCDNERRSLYTIKQNLEALCDLRGCDNANNTNSYGEWVSHNAVEEDEG